jgi:hypothetical protein
MVKSISSTEKRSRGRPATNPTSIHLTLAPEPLAKVDRWIGQQKEAHSRPEAIRRLVELGLTVKAPAPPPKPGRRARAQELAAKVIEKMLDPAAPPEERAQRRRKLTKGPAEFREDRVDQPKAKGKS